MRIIGFIIGLFIATFSFGQTEKKDVYDLPIPKNLESCFEVLDITLSDIKLPIQDLPETTTKEELLNDNWIREIILKNT